MSPVRRWGGLSKRQKRRKYRLNEFQLYTGTSSVAVMVTASNGSQIYADTVAGKQVGYTPSEAKQKSLEAAAALAVKRMTE